MAQVGFICFFAVCYVGRFYVIFWVVAFVAFGWWQQFCLIGVVSSQSLFLVFWSRGLLYF